METYSLSEFRKLLLEEITVGATKTTYLGVAEYYHATRNINGYAVAGDTARAIRRIKKIVEETVGGTKTTETFYPAGDAVADQIWDNRASLTYV